MKKLITEFEKSEVKNKLLLVGVDEDIKLMIGGEKEEVTRILAIAMTRDEDLRDIVLDSIETAFTSLRAIELDLTE